MFFISHRGNLTGATPSLENNPNYIKAALNNGYDVEIDVRYDCKTDTWWLGHDKPQYRIHPWFLQNRRLWCHAKTLDTLIKIQELPGVHYFFHDKDTATLTSNCLVWSHFVGNYRSNAVYVMPEWHVEFDITRGCLGICSDKVATYKKEYYKYLLQKNSNLKSNYENTKKKK